MAEINENAADLDINFARNFFTNDVTRFTGDAAIRRALKNLVLLKSNEKPFHPEINSGIADLLFENTSPIIVQEIKKRVEKVIRTYEPRVSRTMIKLQYDIDRSEVKISIMYTIKNIKKVFDTTITLQRTR
jgi:phage baseplate assembly protein W